MKLMARSCIFALLFSSSAHAGYLMNPGKWRIIVEVKVIGAPIEVPPTTVLRCITPEQAENPEPPGGEGEDCKMSDYKIDGNVVTWSVNCEKQQMTGTGKITYAGDSSEGLVHLKSPVVEVVQTLTGQRIGECDAAAAH